ncbi:MAG: hypothetical protein ACYC0N_00680 [Carboxydocellales bacterium]
MGLTAELLPEQELKISVTDLSRHHVLGILDKTKIVLDRDLTNEEKAGTLIQIRKAMLQGFNSCIVTTNGTYATKKLYP